MDELFGRDRLRRIVRAGLTVPLALCLLARLVRAARHWSGVADFFFPPDAGPFVLIAAALFLGPVALPLLCGLALWSRGRRARSLGLICLSAGGFFTLEEGLVLFARSMNGHGGYVGAEPGLSLFVCLISAAVVLQNRRPR